MGTSHHLGQNFSKAFNIKFLDKDEKEKYVWQTSWGFSTRMIGAMVMMHGDDKGLVLPPKVAPIQAVIIPIPYKDADSTAIMTKAKEIHDKLKKHGILAVLDDRSEYTPGWKFNEWELKGVPIRIEIGPRDLKQKQATLARRDTFERISIKEEEIADAVANLLEEIQKNLFNKAKKFLEKNITTVKTYEEFKKTLKENGGLLRACWCANSACEEKIKEETGATIRIVPFETEKAFSKCVYCGKEAKEVVYFARAY
jgi:prolyl-tRNA synthetase